MGPHFFVMSPLFLPGRGPMDPSFLISRINAAHTYKYHYKCFYTRKLVIPKIVVVVLLP